MTAWIRSLLTLIRSLWKPRLRPDEESVLDLRVWPTDADLTYMNHARYLTIMEQGRIGIRRLRLFRGLAARPAHD